MMKYMQERRKLSVLHVLSLSFLFYLSSTNKAIAQTINVKDFGAVNDTTVLSTEAFNKAVDKCVSMGGGTVIVPSGNYLCTSILLKDNVNLILECGAMHMHDFAENTLAHHTQKPQSTLVGILMIIKIIPECLELLIPMV